MLEHEKKRERIEIVGWILFVFCAGCYIATSYIADDVIGIIGGLLFLAACIVFLSAYFVKPEEE